MNKTHGVNLTSLPTEPTFLNKDDLKNINELAKPGEGYELTLSDPNTIFWDTVWEQYRSAKEEQTVTVQFMPKYGTIKINVPANFTVLVNKYSAI